MRRGIIPVDLGGSPTRCALRPPRRKADLADTVEALIHRYQDDRTADSWEVAFFHGGLPTVLQMEACGGLSIRLACSPADLDRPSAQALWEAGVRTIEIEALTFQPRVLRYLSRGYTAGRVRTMIESLSQMGFDIGLVLSPGLPGFRVEDCLEDAQELARLAGRVSFARVNPALAFEGSSCAAWLEEGRWIPLEVEEAIPICRQMVDRIEGAGIDVARVGLQPRQDLQARVIAGPIHPNLRGLVQSARFRDRIEHALLDVPSGEAVELRVNPKDLSWIKGISNENIREIRGLRALTRLDVVGDRAIPRGEIRVTLGMQSGETG